MRTISCFVILLIFVFALSAQENSSPKHDSTATNEPKYFLSEIIVTAPRSSLPLYQVPNSIQVLDREDIQRGEIGLSLEESLRSVPGVLVNNRNNLSQGDRISIRGIGSRASFGVRGIKLVVDEIPLTMSDGQSQLNNLDLGSTGQIEVWRGPSSSLYGNASGGLINIKTELPTEPGLVFQPKVIVGSHGLQKWQGKISGTIGRNVFLINTARLKTQGFREHSTAKSISINGLSKHTFSNLSALNMIFNFIDSPYLLNPSSLAKSDAKTSPEMARFFVRSQGAGKKVRQAQAGVTLSHKNLRTTIYGLSRSLLNPIPGRIIELERKAGGIRSVFEKYFRREDWSVRWLVGSDVEIQKDERVEFENLGLLPEQVDVLETENIFSQIQRGDQQLNQGEKVWGLGAFSEFELNHKTWALTVGARYDRFRFEAEDYFLQDGSNDSGKRVLRKLSPKIGINYRPKPNLSVYGNLSTGFQTPTTSELSNRADGQGGFNPSLQPEKMKSYEIGLKNVWLDKNIYFETTFYRLEIRDMLIPFQVPASTTEEIFFRNAGRARNHGLEINFNWLPINNFKTSVAYTLMNFKFQDYVFEFSDGAQTNLIQLSGNKVPGVPSQHLFFNFIYHHPAGVYSELNFQWQDHIFANDFNGPMPGSTKPADEFINDSYFLADLRMGLKRKFGPLNLELFFGVNNLFDERYNGSIVPNAFGDRFFEPAPGRNFYNGLTVSVASFK